MTDPTLAAEIAAARTENEQAKVETARIAAALEEMSKDLDAIKASDRVRAAALVKVRADWDFLKDRLHDSADRQHRLANRFVELQERHLSLVEGPPPPTEPKERP